MRVIESISYIHLLLIDCHYSVTNLGSVIGTNYALVSHLSIFVTHVHIGAQPLSDLRVSDQRQDKPRELELL